MEGRLLRPLEDGPGVGLTYAAFLIVVYVDPELFTGLELLWEIVLGGVVGVAVRYFDNLVPGERSVLAVDAFCSCDFTDMLKCVLVGIKSLFGTVFAECYIEGSISRMFSHTHTSGLLTFDQLVVIVIQGTAKMSGSPSGLPRQNGSCINEGD